MSEVPVRWGFLGAGFVASRALAPAVHAAEGARLQVVAARDEGRARELNPKRAVTSYRQVCESEDVDVVYLSLPNDSHLEWVMTALEAGKDVVCEKPLGLTATEVAAMKAAAENTGCMLVEASWNRWHPRTQRLFDLVAARPGAKEIAASFTFDGVPSGNYRIDPNKGGGALYDVGCYAVAAALAMIGSDVEVADVEVHVGPTGIDLTTSARLTSSAGSAHILGSFEQPERQSILVNATDFAIEVPHPVFTSWREESTLRVLDNGSERIESFAPCDAYQLMVEAVSARHRGRDAWVLPLQTSWNVAHVLDEIRRRSAPD